MWLASIYSKTLRAYRVAILAWGLGLGGLMVAVIASYPSLTGSPDARAALLQLAPAFAWYNEPVAILTPGGYTTWRAAPLLLAVGIWALLAASQTLRGEEESGSLDVLLSMPRSRCRVAMEKLAALGTALLLVGLLIGLVTLAGGASVGAGFGPSQALLFGLNVALAAAVYAMLALLLSQFTRERRSAAVWTGGLLALSVLLNATARMVEGAEGIVRCSPVYYYGLSKPLVAGYGANGGAMLVLAALAALAGGAAVWLFLRRDVGVAVPLPARLPRRAAAGSASRTSLAGDWSVRSVYARSLSVLGRPAAWWAIGAGVFGGWMTLLAKETEQQVVELLRNSPFVGQVAAGRSGGDLGSDAGFVSLNVFTMLPLLLAAFAVAQAGRWATDEEEGRLELLLATPQPRPAVILARFAALATAVLAVAVVTLVAVAAAAATTGLSLDGGHLVAATLGMAPPALLLAALGYLLAGWLRATAVTGALSGLLAASFVVDFLGPAVHWPRALLQLSLFQQYGTPLVSGLRWPNTLGLLVAAALALAVATIRFAGKDIGR